MSHVVERWPLPIHFIDLQAQRRRIGAAIDARMRAVLEHGQFIMGPEIAELEERLCDFVGVRHAITVADGTTALTLALMTLGLRPGDEVITTPFTFFATGEVLALAGCVPVLVDIDPATYNIDVKRIEAAVTERTRAILPVSLFGLSADMDAINAIARKHDLAVVEDAAQSFGALYKGRRSGASATIACTSFFPSKPLGCYGDGGACFTNDDELADRLRRLRVHGQSKRYVHSDIGVNARLDTLQAAVLLAKLDAFEQEIADRAAAGRRYGALVSARDSTSTITVPWVPEGYESVFAQYTVRVPNRAEAMAALGERGVPVAVHYPLCLHQQPAFERVRHVAHDLTEAERAAREVMSLPMHPDLDPALQEFIIDALVSAVA